MDKLKKIIDKYELYDKLIYLLTIMLIPIYGLFDGHVMVQIVVL